VIDSSLLSDSKFADECFVTLGPAGRACPLEPGMGAWGTPNRGAVGSRLEAAATEPRHFLRRRFLVFRGEVLAEAAAL
jgi:hypothetical protein